MKSDLFRPKELKKTDKVALVAPSGPSYDSVNLIFSINYLRRLGFFVWEGQSCHSLYGYLAGNDRLRADDLNQAFADQTVAGIFCLRGGYGAARILDLLDFDIIRANPKFFCGYSDITALHNAFNQRAGFMTFHTPVVGEASFPNADDFTLDSMNKYVFQEGIGGEVVNPIGYEWEFLTIGAAEGMLTGGNLSVMASLIGTAYEVDTAGKILFIEDVGEKPYRIDRMLNQLAMAGKFADCAGVVFGDFTDCAPTNPARSLSIRQIISNLGLKVPVLYNLCCGHCLPSLSLPLGAAVRLDSFTNSFRIL